jgi:HEAT repeat protein
MPPQNAKSELFWQEIRSKIGSADDKLERYRIIRELAELKAPEVWGVLLESLHDPSEDIRDLVIKTLGKQEAIDLDSVCQKLTQFPWYVKSGCLRILGLRKDPRTIKSIATVVDDSNTDVRVQAAWALGEIGGEESLLLLARMIKDRNRFVRLSAEKALQKAGDLKFSEPE